MHSNHPLIVSVVSACIYSFVVATPIFAQPTARVKYARGDVSADGQQLQTGDPIRFGASVKTGPMAMATIRVEWPKGGTSCFIESMFGFGNTFPVSPPSIIQTCDARGVTHYDGVSNKIGSAPIGKGDSPAKTTTATAAYAEFEALRTALEAGMIMRVGENRSAADYNLPGQNVASAAACAALCARDSRCTAMTFITKQNSCWLKQDRGEAEAAPGMVSAVKPINPKAIVPKGQ
jgi:hypothetical protein